MSKQDRQGARTPADLERKYDFDRRFKENATAAAEAKKMSEDLDKSLTADEVFNRLTDGGQVQGIYKEDGNIYINASYIKAGVLLATLITAGILQSQDKETFYLDLDKGVLRGKFDSLTISGKTVEEIAAEKSSSAVSQQSQEDIYNKLTNNGTAAGIFYQNGQLYINADYLTAGVIESSDGNTFSLDLKNNVLKGKFTEIYIAGKKASWQEGEDGTFTLVGT